MKKIESIKRQIQKTIQNKEKYELQQKQLLEKLQNAEDLEIRGIIKKHKIDADILEEIITAYEEGRMNMLERNKMLEELDDEEIDEDIA